jgi:broad specificity phosphatase PhoE
MATRIFIIRHGEKPADTGFPHGVNHHGEKDSDSLSVRGWQRAGGLAQLFVNEMKPDHLFAPKSGKSSAHSKRSAQVITPLAEKLGIEVNTEFNKGEEKDLAHHVKGLEGTVLIAWEHANVHLIANHICKGAPQEWPGDRYDLIYVFDYSDETKSFEFHMAYQMLLDGDKDQ